MDRRRGGREVGRKGAGGVEVALIEMGERLLGLGQVAGCDVDVADEFVDIFRDDLELDGYVGEALAAGSVFLNGEFVYCSELAKCCQTFRAFIRKHERSST